MFHTVDEDFEHFLSYSGMRNEPQDTLRKLYLAFKAAWDPCQSAQQRRAAELPSSDEAGAQADDSQNSKSAIG